MFEDSDSRDDYIKWYRVPCEKEDGFEKYKIWMLHWLHDKQVTQGSKGYFVQRSWVIKYVRWLESDKQEPEPGPVDIYGDKTPVSPDNYTISVHGRQWMCLHQIIWDHIIGRFTILDDRQPISREVIDKQDGYGAQPEFTLQEMFFVHPEKPRETKRWWVPLQSWQADSFELGGQRCFGYPKDRPVRISFLIRMEPEIWEVQNYKCCTAYEYFVRDQKKQRVFMAEQMNPDGTWPRTVTGPQYSKQNHMCKNLIRPHSYLEGDSIPGGYVSEKAYPGLTGFDSNESSCYMAATIWILTNIPSLRDYFLTDTHLRDLNMSNPLGRKGEFAKILGHTLKNMWSGKYCHTRLQKFKRLMGSIRAEYGDYFMHDCHEFLMFFLDGVHEDCNLVKKKPMVEDKPAGDRPAKEVAEEYWQGFKARNQSVVVDVFYGLTQTRTYCPQCNASKLSHEPSMCLSLGVPYEDHTLRKVCFRYLDASKPVSLLKVELCSVLSVMDVKQLIAEQVGVPAESMRLGLIGQNDRYTWRELVDKPRAVRELMTDHRTCPVCALEAPPDSMKDDSKFLFVNLDVPPISSRKIHNPWMYDNTSVYRVPFFVKVKSKATYDDVYEAVLKILSDRLPEPGDGWWEKDADMNVVAEVRKAYRDDKSPELNLSNDKHNWCREGKHYIFRIMEDTMQRKEELKELDNNGKAMTALKHNTVLMVQFHPVYAKHYMEKGLYDKPKVELLPSRYQTDPVINICSIEHCLKVTLGREEFKEKWSCTNCEETVYHERTTGFWYLPNYLLVQFKRFFVNYSNPHKSVKRCHMVTFPELSLDLSQYISNPEIKAGEAIYDLHAVINHSGERAEAGHYYAFARYEKDQSWYMQDDAKVFCAFPEELQTRYAYMLMYRKRGIEELKFEARGPVTQPDFCMDTPEEQRMREQQEREKKGMYSRSQMYMEDSLSKHMNMMKSYIDIDDYKFTTEKETISPVNEQLNRPITSGSQKYSSYNMEADMDFDDDYDIELLGNMIKPVGAFSIKGSEKKIKTRSYKSQISEGNSISKYDNMEILDDDETNKIEEEMVEPLEQLECAESETAAVSSQSLKKQPSTSKGVRK